MDGFAMDGFALKGLTVDGSGLCRFRSLRIQVVLDLGRRCFMSSRIPVVHADEGFCVEGYYL
jgi:hypothetical protein